jgi:hypothetical protein
MRELKEIETSVLVDMLAQETARFVELFRIYFSVKNNQEYENCKENIRCLVEEFRNRNIASTDPTLTSSKETDHINPAKIISFLLLAKQQLV